MSQAPISPLRRRMIEDMTVRGFGEKTQNVGIRAWTGSSIPSAGAKRCEEERAEQVTIRSMFQRAVWRRRRRYPITVRRM
jgi:hypothetical protein